MNTKTGFAVDLQPNRCRLGDWRNKQHLAEREVVRVTLEITLYGRCGDGRGGSMARPLRIEFAGAIYHVTGRMLGSWRQAGDRLFCDELRLIIGGVL